MTSANNTRVLNTSQGIVKSNPRTRKRKVMEQTNKYNQETYIYNNQDGLGDIIAGIIVTGFGAGLLTGMFWLGGGLVTVLIPLWIEAKKRFSRRRGVVSPTPIQLDRNRATLAVVAGLGVLTLLVSLMMFMIFSQESFMPGLWNWLQEYFELAIGGVAALLLAMIGAITRTRRYYLYAVLALAIFTAGYLLKISLGISVMLLGGLIFLGGLVILIRFLSEHPAPEKN
jgi:hypothetical protein